MAWEDYWKTELGDYGWVDDGFGDQTWGRPERTVWNTASGYASPEDYLVKTRGIPAWMARYVDKARDGADAYNRGRAGALDAAGFVLPNAYGGQRGTGNGKFDLGWIPDDNGDFPQEAAFQAALQQQLAGQGSGFAMPLADVQKGYQNSNIPGAGYSFNEYLQKQYQNPQIVDVPGVGKVVTAGGVNTFDWGLSNDKGFFDTLIKEIIPTGLKMYGAMTGIGGLADLAMGAASSGAASGAGSMFDAAGAGADMFGQGAIDLGNYGAASAGAGSAMLDPSLITSPVAPVSTGAPVYDPLADFNGLTPGNYSDLGGTLAPTTLPVPTSVGDPFIDAYTPPSANVPQGTWTPTPGVGTVASAINNLLGTSLTDADVSTGVKVGTTAAGLLAGSGAAGATDPLPGSDTSGLDAAKARTRSSIAGMFDGQDPRYQGIRDSVLGFQKSNLDRDREEAARKLKFSLLRTGNAGGSLQVDEGSKLGRTYDRGLLDATNLADQAAQSARSSDASTKLDLLGRVDSGLDQDAATASAAEQMRIAGDRATSQGLGTTLGNVFADAGLMFQTDAARRGLTDARKAFPSMFSTVPGSSGGSYTGITGRA